MPAPSSTTCSTTTTGALLLVSHDRMLLDRMDRIAELRRGEITFYGGNFTAYEESVSEAQRVAESNVRNAEQQLKREKRQMQQARERAARRSSTAARNVKDAGLPKIIAGAMKRRAQESAGRIDGVNAARVDDARGPARRRRTRAARRPVDRARPARHRGARRPQPCSRATGLRMSRGGRALFGDGIDVSIRGPERIALTGPNGAGKSTLLRVISGELEPDAGTIQRADGRIAYLSQRLDLLDPDRTVLENLVAYAPNLSETRRMHLLAQFLFRGNRIHLPVAALSGGERLRATLACVLYAEPAPQLLLLDEPTNNLDLVSIGAARVRAERLPRRVRRRQPRHQVPRQHSLGPHAATCLTSRNGIPAGVYSQLPLLECRFARGQRAAFACADASAAAPIMPMSANAADTASKRIRVARDERAGVLQRQPAEHAVDVGGQPGDGVDGADVAEPHRVVERAQRDRRLAAALGRPSRVAGRRPRTGRVTARRRRPRPGQQQLRGEQHRFQPVPRLRPGQRL